MMNFHILIKYIPIFILTCQFCGSFAYITMRSDEISGKMDEILSDLGDTNDKSTQTTAPAVLRSDEFSIFDDDVKDMPAYKGGLFKGFLTEKGRKKKEDRVQKTQHEKPPQKDGHMRQDSNRVRRAVTDPQVTAAGSSYTEWGSWSKCSSDSCTVKGSQIRYRSCFTFDSSQTGTIECSYEYLVQEQRCYPQSCSDSRDTRWSEWGDWSTCDITCGKGGLQLRFRLCLTFNGTEFDATQNRCNGSERENKPCQYKSSCPQWDNWGVWSQCSGSCSQGGVATRKRSCVYYRYHAIAATGQTLMQEFSGSSEQNETVMIQTMGSLTSMPDETDGDTNSSNSLKDVVKEIIDQQLCVQPGENSKEKKNCDLHSNCSLWTTWGVWSKCHRSCAPGFRRRERKCNKNNEDEPCTGGYKTQYRRCYPPPCWGPWAMMGTCSVTCGKGEQKRIRKCKIYAQAHPFNKCEGDEMDTVECDRPACDNSNGWSEWSLFTKCSTTCGFRGVKFRNRTCQTDKCNGLSRDAEPCNRQICSVWGRWGPLSCCHTSCGPGYSTRTRLCIFGSKCPGESRERHQCYSVPCEKPANNTLDGLKCGIRSKSIATKSWLKIINGKNAPPSAWPWQGSWQRQVNKSIGWKHFCGVSLIHPRWVITAAHCYDRAGYMEPYNLRLELPAPDSWSVLFGMNDIRMKGGVRHYIYKTYVHEDYKVDVVANHDVALMKLTSFVTFSDSVSPICLPGGQVPEPGQLCMATGWGQTKPGSAYASVLQEASIPYLDFDDCRYLGDDYRNLNEDIHICAGSKTGNVSDTCEGDSGGPLACMNGNMWYLAGITSFSFADCGTPGQAGIYANVAKYQDWINEIIRNSTYDNC